MDRPLILGAKRIATGLGASVASLFLLTAIALCVVSPFSLPILGYFYDGDIGAVLGLLIAIVIQFLLVSIIYVARSQWTNNFLP